MRWIVAFLACIGISQAQVVTHQIADDSWAYVPLQFPFPLHGRIFTDSYMFSNGVVGFGSINQGWCCTGYDLANQQGYHLNYSILGLQTDLINYGSGRFQTEGTPQYQRYRWENISEFGAPQNLNTFGIEIRPSGFIGIYHENININSWRPVTVGITGDTTRGEYTQFYHGQGYTSNIPVAYITQTTGDLCLIDPLSSPSCSGYQQAYLNQQCAISQLYSPSCPNYAQTYHDQQCSLNPLYATDCQGYAQAYFNEQCRLNPLYDRTCTGYSEAYALANVVPSTRTQTSTPSVQISTTGTVTVETPIIADAVVNDVVTRPVQTSNISTTSQPTQSISSPVSQVRQVETKKEEKKETKQGGEGGGSKESKKENKQSPRQIKVETANNAEIKSVEIKTVELPKGVDIIDHSFLKIIANSKTIKDNSRMLLHGDRIHRELFNEQWRR